MSNVKYVLNPFTGEFDSIRDDSALDSVTYKRVCDASLNVGDLVWESYTVTNGVDAATNNTDVRPVFGIAVKKPTSTTVEVLIIGTVEGFAGLTKARKVFLSTSGTITSTVAATGYLQCLGVARDPDVVDFQPQLERVLRV
jgi:hypothetical protein